MIPVKEYTERMVRLQEAVSNQQLDAFLVSQDNTFAIVPRKARDIGKGDEECAV